MRRVFLVAPGTHVKLTHMGHPSHTLTPAPAVESWSEVDLDAKRIDSEEPPRRKQTNLDLPVDRKRAFMAIVKQNGK